MFNTNNSINSPENIRGYSDDVMTPFFTLDRLCFEYWLTLKETVSRYYSMFTPIKKIPSWILVETNMYRHAYMGVECGCQVHIHNGLFWTYFSNKIRWLSDPWYHNIKNVGWSLLMAADMVARPDILCGWFVYHLPPLFTITPVHFYPLITSPTNKNCILLSFVTLHPNLYI